MGLGNIWRFPGVAYENGGGAFLIPYIVAQLTAAVTRRPSDDQAYRAEMERLVTEQELALLSSR